MNVPRAPLIVLMLSAASIACGAGVEYTATPLALIVAPRDEYPRIRINRILHGNLDFDEVLRPPVYPETGATVHCAKTMRIGVLLLIERSRV